MKEKIIIEMDLESYDYTIDFNNGGNGINTEGCLLAIVGLVRQAQDMFNIPFANIMGLICEEQVNIENKKQEDTEEDKPKDFLEA